MYKSKAGLPEPLWPRNVDLRAESGIARRRLYPITVAYSAASAVTLAVVFRSGRDMGAAAGFLAAGVATWTLLEYLVMVLNTVCGRLLRAGEPLWNPGVLMPTLGHQAQATPRAKPAEPGRVITLARRVRALVARTS